MTLPQSETSSQIDSSTPLIPLPETYWRALWSAQAARNARLLPTPYSVSTMAVLDAHQRTRQRRRWLDRLRRRGQSLLPRIG